MPDTMAPAKHRPPAGADINDNHPWQPHRADLDDTP